MNNLMNKMAGVLFNLFAGNIVRDINSEVHAKRKPSAATRCDRSQSDDKIRKLSGAKKN